MLITRRAEFSASHVCAQPSLTPEQNRELYGAAANPSGHGHNYVLEVTLEGDPDPVTGMVFDLKKLKDLIQQTVIEPMDHRFLNYEVAELKGLIPTCENIAIVIWKLLQPKIPQGRLHRVRLYESPDLFADCYGEEAAS